MKEWFKLSCGYALIGLLGAAYGGLYYLLDIHTLSMQFSFVLLWFINAVIAWNKLDIKI